MNKNFKCDKCGKCCQNLSRSNLYSDLDRGDGICKYYNIKTHLCNIYDTRPIKCRIIDSYEFYKEIFSYDEYIKINEEGCRKIKEEL